ncbi:MAG: cation diffusion facilitator family transporter [Alphaproteobacteria bacterium]
MDKEQLRRRATYASIGVAVTLIAIKLGAYFMTDSVAMLSSLLDSTVDLLASLTTGYGVATALHPPDHDHRYGHGKAEPLAALVQAAFIFGSSVLLGYEALNRFYHPRDIQHEVVGYFTMLLAIFMTMGLIAYQRYVIRHTGSMAIGADRLHYTSDLAVNAAVIVAFGVTQLTDATWIDPVFAIIIAGGMCYGAFGIAKEALNVLMDKELSDDEREKIKVIAMAQMHVRGMHDLRTRTDGERIFIEFHLELDPEMTLRMASQVNEAVIKAIRHEYPNADVQTHQDPEGLVETRLDQKIAENAIAK